MHSLLLLLGVGAAQGLLLGGAAGSRATPRATTLSMAELPADEYMPPCRKRPARLLCQLLAHLACTAA